MIPGVLVIEGNGEIESLTKTKLPDGIALVTLVDDADFVADHFHNWLWVTLQDLTLPMILRVGILQLLINIGAVISR